jgi:alpha-galactosidase
MTFRTALHLLLVTLTILSGVSPARTPKSLALGQSESDSTLLASTPPMGWNSWDAYGYTVREDEVKANVDYMAKNLAGYGWQYIVVDIEWYTPQTKPNGYIPDPTNVTLDEFGRLTPALNRFPSAAEGAGFKPLADYVHSKGLKFGIHIMRGIPREAVEKNLPVQGTHYHAADVADKIHVCTWPGMTDMYGVDASKAGGQAYYDSIAELYASWGVDFVKADDMLSPFHASEIEALSRALRKTGRPIVLSLSPGPAPVEQAEFLRANAQMWRISEDFWDSWPSLKRQFELTRRWETHIHPGGWPDADMLALGRLSIRGEVGGDRPSRFTRDEQRTVLTLWSIFRSPLIFGGDLPSNDAFTLSLLTNSDVIAVDQHSSGNHQSYIKGSIIAWLADAPGSRDEYVAVFNIGDSAENVDLSWADVSVNAKRAVVRDLWQSKDVGTREGIHEHLKPHVAVLYKISPQ